MGTRHIIAIIHEGKYKLAQYGQWDGYPSGQGADVLAFLRERFDRKRLIEGLNACYEPSDEQVKQWHLALGADEKRWDEGFVSCDVGDKFSKLYPSLSRDTGSDILDIIQKSVTENEVEAVPLQLFTMTGKGAWIEYVYVVDLDTNVFRAYSGMMTELLATYDLDNLPTLEDFLAECDPPEEDEEDEDGGTYTLLLEHKEGS